MATAFEQTIRAFKQGLPVCLFDSQFREGETDLLFPAISASPEQMRQLRQDCGGLLFLAIGHEIVELFGLPYLQDIHSDSRLIDSYPILTELITDDLQYDSRSAFTLSLNHRDTFTGITDLDRSLTTRRFAELAAELLAEGVDNESARNRLGQEFRTPGHIPVCREQEGGLLNREGHTELAVALARACDLPHVVIGAEMLQLNGDLALDANEARTWAETRKIPFLSGDELKDAIL